MQAMLSNLLGGGAGRGGAGGIGGIGGIANALM